MSMVDQSCAGSPFHPGERAIQQRLGLRDKMEAVGRRVLRDFMPDQHREFFAALPFLVLGTAPAMRPPPISGRVVTSASSASTSRPAGATAPTAWSNPSTKADSTSE